MKLPLFLPVFILLCLFACQKEENMYNCTKSNYRSQGNLLILKIGDQLEGAYEYNLPSTVLNNDSLPLYFESYPNGTSIYQLLKFAPHPNAILQFSSQIFTFFATEIDPKKLATRYRAKSINLNSFQYIGNTQNIDIESVWAKVSKLSIVHGYLGANPHGPVGIMRIIVNEFDEQLGFGIPKEKQLLFFTK